MTMALLRRCNKILQTFSKLQTRYQIERIRNLEFVTGARGYVTLAPKYYNSNINSSEKIELHSRYTNDNRNNEISPEFGDGLYRKLVLLCLNAKNGMVRNNDLMKILNQYSNDNSEMRNTIALALLRYCGSSLVAINATARRNLTNHVWNIICSTTSDLTLEHYHTLLCIHAQNREMIDIKLFLQTMTVEPDSTTFQLLLNVAAKHGNIDTMGYLLSKMKSIGYAMNESAFNSLIEGHSNNKDIKAALSILENMRNVKIEPSSESYANIAYGYASLGNVHDTMKIMNSYSLSTEQLMEIVKRLSISGFGKHIPDAMIFLKSKLGDDYVFISQAITELTYAGKSEDAFSLIENITKIEESLEKLNLFRGFFKDIVRVNVPKETIMKFVNEAMTKNIYSSAITDVCETALRNVKEDLALAVFEKMHEINIEVRPHYYWPLLVQASKARGELDVFRILNHMISLNVQIDHDTCYYYVLPYINVIHPITALQKLGQLGIGINIVFTPLVCYLLRTKGLEDALALCEQKKGPLDFSKVLPYLVKAYKMTKNINRCAMMFTYAPPGKYFAEEFLMTVFNKNANDYGAYQLKEFLRIFKTLGVSVINFEMGLEEQNSESEKQDTKNEIKLIDSLESIRPTNRIPHPRDMNREELECHLIELNAKSMNQRGVMRKLIQLYCRENNLVRVEELSKEYNKNNYAWSPGMYSNVIELYSKNGKATEALSLYSMLRSDHEDFEIDRFKILSLAIALAKEDRMNDVIALLEENPGTESDNNSRRARELLDVIAHSSNNEMTDKIFDILMKMRYCLPSNSLVGPLVRQHILRGDLKTAVDTFRKYAENYRYTPLRQILLGDIVKAMKEDVSRRNELIDLLQQVQNITREIRGIVVANNDLITAFALNGMKNELRKVVEKNQVLRLLDNHLQRMPEEEKLIILREILDVSTNLRRINRDSIYEQILEIHSRSGDCEKAIELWREMSSENLSISRSFRLVFISLLEKHNVPLPEDFMDCIS